jgi:hypothetical protein
MKSVTFPLVVAAVTRRSGPKELRSARRFSLLLPPLVPVSQGMDITMIQSDNWHPFTSLQGVPAARRPA